MIAQHIWLTKKGYLKNTKLYLRELLKNVRLAILYAINEW